MSGEAPLVVWRLTDGRRGHENQTLGLAEALYRRLGGRRPLDLHDLPVPAPLAALGQWLGGRFPAGAALPDPDLILAAGHRSHFALLAARRARGGRSVVLMKPSLPLSWFDLCIAPEHDDPPARDNLLTTRGALNRMQTGDHSAADEALVLLGGPSRRHRWEGERIAWQLAELIAARPGLKWTVADSRRTPAGFLDSLTGLDIAKVSHASVDGDWLPAQLARAGHVWVSEDSVNMVYEALTAGCAVGVLRLPRIKEGRVTRGLDRLLADGTVVDFEAWRGGREPTPPAEPFDEAARCARWIVERWFHE